MKATCEAVLHAAVVGPVYVLAGMIGAAAKLCRTAVGVAGRISGDEGPSPAGCGDLQTA